MTAGSSENPHYCESESGRFNKGTNMAHQLVLCSSSSALLMFFLVGFMGFLPIDQIYLLSLSTDLFIIYSGHTDCSA